VTDPVMEINKELVAASSTPIVLAILAEGDSYGYAILKRVRELSEGHLRWTDGMLYPVLHRLERLGHVEARWEVPESGRRRKYYRITPLGRAQIEEERRQWEAVDATLRGVWRGTLHRAAADGRRLGRRSAAGGGSRAGHPAVAGRTAGGGRAAAGRRASPAAPLPEGA